jgi:DNA invertase Pin-like site-specific DNA recombinase
MFQMLGLFAEFERAIIAERIHAGLSRAREQGTKSGIPIGRPERFINIRERAQALKDQWIGTRRIADQLGNCGRPLSRPCGIWRRRDRKRPNPGGGQP